MKSTTHREFTSILIVGAGGIGCQLANMLALTHKLTFMDGDSYEPKNATRQFPALKSEENKATTLAGILRDRFTGDYEGIPYYVKGIEALNFPAVSEASLIVAAVDNNKARKSIVEIAEALETPAILAANDETDAEAHLFFPTVYNPFDFFPFPDNEPAPFDCNADQTIEERPQTVIANVMAAAAVCQLLLSLQTTKNPLNLLCAVRMDAKGSAFRRVRHFAEGGNKEDPWLSGSTPKLVQSEPGCPVA